MTSAYGAQGSGAGGMRGEEMNMTNFVDDAHGRRSSFKREESIRHQSLTSSSNINSTESSGGMNVLHNIVDMQVNDAAMIAKQSLEQKMEEITKAFIVARRQSGTGLDAPDSNNGGD